jgi:hypothetical protein
MSELLESRWQDTKTALLEGLNGNKKAVMAVLLKIHASICQRLRQQVQLRR